MSAALLAPDRGRAREGASRRRRDAAAPARRCARIASSPSAPAVERAAAARSAGRPARDADRPLRRTADSRRSRRNARRAAPETSRSRRSATLPTRSLTALRRATARAASIHAATMVTAGVYLVVRTHVLFEISGVALTVVLVIGPRHRAVRGHLRAGPGRHQARARLLDHLAARLHVLRRRHEGLRGRDVHAGRARVLQGADVPRRRLGDPRHARRAGHEADGWPLRPDARHGRDLPRRARSHWPGCRRSPGSSRRTRSWRSRATPGVPGSTRSARSDPCCPPRTSDGWCSSRSSAGPGASRPSMRTSRRRSCCGRSSRLAVGAGFVGLLNRTPEGRLAGFLEPVVGRVPEGEAGFSALTISVVGAVVAVALLALMWLTYGSGRVDWLALRVRLGSRPAPVRQRLVRRTRRTRR